MKPQLYKISFFSILVFSFLALFTYGYAPNFIVETKNPLIELAKTTLEDETEIEQVNGIKQIFFVSKDKLKLKANIYQVPNPKATIILLHGIRSSKEQWDEEARMFNTWGYNAVVPDLRAHGESQGTYCSFGYYEKQDIKTLLDTLQYQGYKARFGIWGHSLGGAIALQTLAKDKRLQFGIIESSYADFKQITKDYSRYYLQFESDIINDFLLERAGEMAGFPVEAVNPVDYCYKIDQPILIIHGAGDQKINPANAKILFEKTASKQKKLILVQGAGHTNIHQVGGKELFAKIHRFINDVL